MSNAEEFETVDILEREEEDALSDDEVMPELGDNLVQGGIVLRPLVPLDRRGASRIHIGDEFGLRNNYDILPPVLLHFQNPVTLEIQRGDIVIYEKMLTAGLRLPFPDIAREMVLYSEFPRVRSHRTHGYTFSRLSSYGVRCWKPG
jgi:hypothetical protein